MNSEGLINKHDLYIKSEKEIIESKDINQWIKDWIGETTCIK